MQMLSVTGLWGIPFLIGWFAGVVNWTWQRKPADARGWYPLALFAGVYLAVIILGGARLALSPPSSPTVRVASLSPTKNGPKIAGTLQAVITGKASDEQIRKFRTATAAGQGELLKRSEHEAAAGAKVIFWSETAAYVRKWDEPELPARGQALASKYHLYLGMALGTWTPGTTTPLENKFVLVDPTGQIAWQYLKARPTPGPEMAISVTSDGILRPIDTPYGKLVSAICYTDFPRLMAQAGTQLADMVFSPANDWRAVDPRHPEIASFRAVEQGFNLVRQSNGGLSAAYDYQGRWLASMDACQAGDLALIAQTPTRGVRTIYSRLGDWLAWVCIVDLLALCGSGMAQRALTDAVRESRLWL